MHGCGDSGPQHLVPERKQGWYKVQEGVSPFPSVPDASCRCRMDLDRWRNMGSGQYRPRPVYRSLLLGRAGASVGQEGRQVQVLTRPLGKGWHHSR